MDWVVVGYLYIVVEFFVIVIIFGYLDFLLVGIFC